MAATGINKEGVALWSDKQPFQVLFQCFDVTTCYFEELLLDSAQKRKCFAGSRLTFLKLGSASASFSECVRNFLLKAMGSQTLVFLCDSQFWPVS